MLGILVFARMNQDCYNPGSRYIHNLQTTIRTQLIHIPQKFSLSVRWVKILFSLLPSSLLPFLTFPLLFIYSFLLFLNTFLPLISVSQPSFFDSYFLFSPSLSMFLSLPIGQNSTALHIPFSITKDILLDLYRQLLLTLGFLFIPRIMMNRLLRPSDVTSSLSKMVFSRMTLPIVLNNSLLLLLLVFNLTHTRISWEEGNWIEEMLPSNWHMTMTVSIFSWLISNVGGHISLWVVWHVGLFLSLKVWQVHWCHQDSANRQSNWWDFMGIAYEFLGDIIPLHLVWFFDTSNLSSPYSVIFSEP